MAKQREVLTRYDGEIIIANTEDTEPDKVVPASARPKLSPSLVLVSLRDR